VGDAVEAESGGAEPFVGTVERLWEDAYGEKWVELRWFYRPEETAHGRLRRHLPNEVFHSAHLDTNPLACVLGKVRVVSEAEFRVLQRESDFDPSGVYVCRMRYNDDTGEFRPLLADRGRQVSMDSVLRPSLAATTGMAAATGAAAGAAETDTRRGRKGGGRGGDGDEGGGDGDAADAEDAEEMTVYRAASLKLQLSAAPARLPCREKEHATIKSFLAQAIRRGGFTGGLYISGMPGTGKTATVRQVVRELGADAAMPPFQFVEINGMKLPSPQFAYSLIWQAFRGKHEAPAKALALLDQRFGAADSRRACWCVHAIARCCSPPPLRSDARVCAVCCSSMN
jgi:origin recognition complex subunit 1